MTVTAHSGNGHLGLASNGHSEVSLGIDPDGNEDAFNPMELLLASLAGCMMKGLQRMVPLLGFHVRAATITLQASRQDSPPQVESISYEIQLDTDESDERLELLHKNLMKFGTITRTLALAVPMDGTIRRASLAERPD